MEYKILCRFNIAIINFVYFNFYKQSLKSRNTPTYRDIMKSHIPLSVSFLCGDCRMAMVIRAM